MFWPRNCLLCRACRSVSAVRVLAVAQKVGVESFEPVQSGLRTIHVQRSAWMAGVAGDDFNWCK